MELLHSRVTVAINKEFFLKENRQNARFTSLQVQPKNLCFPKISKAGWLPKSNNAKNMVIRPFATKKLLILNLLGSPKEEKTQSTKVLSFLNKVLAVAAASIVLAQSPCPTFAEETILSVPGSKVDEVTEVQRTLIEAWGIVRETYVDPTFNKQDWDLKLKETMKEILSLKSAEAAYSKIRSMLATLGDPFTRIVTPQEYENFRINNDGSVDGVGVLIATERDTGRLTVLSTIEGGPAERAGVRPGDELVQINDEVLTGVNGENAATKLRGKSGSVVDLKFRRSVGPDGSSKTSELKELKLKRETIVLTPVFTAVLPHTNPDGHVSNTGYIRLSSFSQNAAADMKKAISKLEDSNVESYILDLRNNPGGLVKAGLDVAEMWLDGNETLVNTVDRHGIMFPINIANGHALTHDPLVVLVNEGSASATEILAGALHDNGRAIIVGQKTYGKGKIQSVSQLDDGSALFVTVAKYLSPSLHQIDQVGIMPDVLCSPVDITKSVSTNAKSPDSERGSLRDGSPQASVERDACVLVAERLF